jgi:hypothetical protein
MQTIMKRKINRIVSQSVVGEYINPFQNNVVIDGVTYLDPLKTFNGCYATCIYNNNFCEIFTPNMTLTADHHTHMKLLKNKWSIIPHILYVKNNVIISSIPYELNETPNPNWISASKTRNFIMDDPLIDFLKYKNINPIVNIPNVVQVRRKRGYSETFDEQLMNNGNNFELSTIEHIQNNVDSKDFITIGESYEAYNISKYIETMNAINNNIPIIYQPVLWNESNKTFGCADLIIKSSMAKKLFLSYESDYRDDIYEVYDIKWSTINLMAGTNNLNNDKGAKTYKAQLWVYTQALNKMTKSKSTFAYIIGKKYKRVKRDDDGKSITESTINAFNEIAKVDFSTEKVNIDTFKHAIKWQKEIRVNKKLNHDPPNDIRLYPNMKNHNSDFHEIKKDLALKNRELTLIYNVGTKHRANAMEHNIDTIDHPNLTSEILGLKPSPTTSLIENILEVNNSKCKEMVIYNDMSDQGNWRNAKIRCYLDIETISTTIYGLAHCRPNYIFMIGVGIVVNDVWDFKIFTVDNLLEESEDKLINDFNTFMNNLSTKYRRVKEIPMYHWSNFEQTNLKPITLINEKFKYYDMCHWVKDNGICVKGSFDFKLKNYTKALYSNKMIDVNWSSGISDGINAMNIAYNYYTHDVGDKLVIKDVEKYNEIDCKAMFAIHQMCKEF